MPDNSRRSTATLGCPEPSGHPAPVLEAPTAATKGSVERSAAVTPHRRTIKNQWIEGVLLAGLALAVGCGQPGPPLPPSTNLPLVVRNFSAKRLGNAVTLGWTVPLQTTDGVRIHRAISANLCVWPDLLPGMSPSPTEECPHIIQVLAPALPAQLPAQTSIDLERLPPVGARSGFVGLAVQFVNRQQKGAGWSGFVAVPLMRVSTPPAGLQTTVVPDGVRLHWNPVSAPERVSVYRQELDTNGQPMSAPQRLAILPAGQTSYLDRSTVWNHTFVYRVRAVAGERTAEVESVDSAAVQVTPRDVFPPPVPSGLQVVLSAGAVAVDLSWEPVTASDLAGYRVYRRTPGGDWVRLNSTLVLTPVFRDEHPPMGSAEYAVSAVDQTGNESQRSAGVAVTVPAAP